MIGGRWWEGANGGGIKAPSKPFSKLLQKSRVSLQAFPKKSLAVLWDFKGLQGLQTSFDAFQIFLLQPPLFDRILDAAGPHSAASLGARPTVRLILRRTSVETRSSRSRDPDRENFQPDRQSDFWEEISIILPSRFHTSLRPVPLDETGLPLFRTRRPLSADG